MSGFWLVFGLIAAPPARATSGINQQLNFQGRLLNNAGAVVADGTYNMEFKIYQDGAGTTAGDTGGTLKWTEDWVYASGSPDNRITVKNGYFSVALGAICPLAGGSCTASTGNSQTNSGVDFNQTTLWLSINIGNTTTAATFGAASGDGEMLPMKRLSAAPYALQAANAGTLGGLSSSQFLQNVAPNAAQQTANLNIVSGAAASVAAAQIQAVASATAPVLILKGGATPGSGADLLQLQNSGGTPLARFDSSGNLRVASTIDTQTATTLTIGGSTATGITLAQTTLVQPSSSSTSAFVVASPTSGTNENVLQVDTTNERVGVGVMPVIQAKLNVVTASMTGLQVYQNGSSDIADFTNGGNGAGTVTVSSGNTNVTGSGSNFLSTIKPNDAIYVNTSTPQIRTITTVTDNITLTASSNFTTSGSGVSYTTGILGAGTVTTNGTTSLVGSGTSFTTMFQVGDNVLVNGETPRMVSAITDNTHLTVSNAFATSVSGLSYMHAGSTNVSIQRYGVGIGTTSPTAALHVVTTGWGQTGILVQAGTATPWASAPLLQVKNSAGGQVFSVDYGGSVTSGAINGSTLGSSGLTFGAAATITTPLSTALTLTSNANAIWSSTNDLTINAGGFLYLGNNSNNSINLGTSNFAHTINIGNTGNTGTQAITIGGNGVTANTLTLDAGTGSNSIAIGNSTTSHSIAIGAGATSTNTSAVTIGSNNAAASTVTIQGGNGSGAVSIQSAASGIINIATANAANTVQIGNTANAVAQTIGIGNNTTASSASTVTIGSTVGASATTVQGGTGNLTLLTNSASAKIIAKSSTNSITAFQVQDTNANAVVNVDTTNQRLGVNTAAPSGLFQVSQGTITAGTVSNSASSAAVTGTSTTFTTTFTPGDSFTITSSGNTCTILSITDNTHLTCTASLSGTSSGSAYTLGNAARVTVAQNGNVGLGTASANRLLDVAVNNTQVSAPMELLEQAGTGDSSLEFKNTNAGQSIYVGQDNSNGGSFTVNSSATAAPASGITYLQSASNTNDGSGATMSVSFATTTAGNAIILATAFDSGATVTFTCGDTQGNSYTTGFIKNDATNGQAVGICYAVGIVGGADTVTVTYGNSATPSFRRVIASEYRGIATSSPTDGANGGSAATTGATDNVSSGSITTTVNGDLIFGAVMDTSALSLISAGTGYTQRANLNDMDTATQDKIQTTAGSVSSTQTFNTTDRYAAVVTAFKPAGAATLTDTFTPNSLLTLSQTGAAKLQNFTNSTTAFQVQNAAGTSLLTVDSANGIIKTNGILQGSTYVDTKGSVGGSQLYTVTASALNYYLSAASSTLNSTTTSTFNITGLPETDGTMAFINTQVSKGATAGSVSTTVAVRINNNAVSSVTTGATTGAVGPVIENYIIMRVNGLWRIMGYNGLNSDTADLAEWIPYTGTEPSSGQVLTVGDSLTGPSAKLSEGAYDTKVIGVVTTNPAQTFGTNNGHATRIALAGRVPVQVSLENGPIRMGDYLTASPTPGVAMKMTKPGRAIGTALGAYDGTGGASIMTQLAVGYADPTSGAAFQNVQGDMAASGNLNIGGSGHFGGDIAVAGTTTTHDLVVAGNARAGSLTVNGAASLADLTVSGTATLAAVTVAGTAVFNGDIALGGIGLARNAVTKRFVATKAITAGAVVVADPANDGQVTTTTTRGDTHVLGVAVSDGAAGEPVEVAISGVIQARVPDNASVRAGDLLVTSPQEGTVEPSASPTVGSVVGKALGQPSPQHLIWLMVMLQ